MNCLRALPRVSKRLIRRGANVAGNEAVHCLCNHIGGSLASACNLGHLGVPNALLVGIHFKCSEHIDFLYKQKRGVLFPEFLSDFSKESGGVSVFVGLAEQLNRLNLFVVFYEHLCVALQKLLNLHKVVFLSQFNCVVPLVEQHAAVNGALHISELDVSVHRVFAQPHRLELLSDRLKHRRVGRDRVDQLAETSEIFQFVVSVRKAFVIVAQFVILSSFCPFLSLCAVVSKIFVRLFKHLVVACAAFDQRDHLGPISEFDP